ncbi:hypothetical protein [Lysinibacillus odysseyi]|uniref:DUF4181 domain-containing protein n=1 Tax=Lysinibacillus odysseyi 34hs-1 = NBRC 100172 TaxID=1220589 RepID=A0A0A3ISW8_9BACI|nr:hypothetical protein [Lysinibacillus odysseyi]KGR87771.1 hypothetical protein CD32_02945 [Lysinibacillus odysseyi 34hs-1 = NBRC 100172]
MTRWKEQIDQEIGSESKFTLATKEKIMQKAAAHEPKRDWRAGMAIAGILFIALLLVLSSPYGHEQQIQPGKDLEQVLEETEVKEFFISGLPFNEEKFTAKDSEFYIGNKKYDKQEDVQFIQSLLKSVSVYEGDEFSEGKDILINMENGDQLKLKLYPYDSLTNMGLKDMETGLFYTVTNDDIWKFYFDYRPKFVNIAGLYILAILLAGLKLFVERSLLKRNNLQKRRKRFMNKRHMIIMVILTVSILCTGASILLTGWMAVHKGGILAGLLLIPSVNYAFERKYELNPTYRKIDLFHYLATAGITALMILWL